MRDEIDMTECVLTVYISKKVRLQVKAFLRVEFGSHSYANHYGLALLACFGFPWFKQRLVIL